MDRNACSFTVLFQPPFWVGIAERWEEAGYSAARVVFGAEPTDAQLYAWLEREWHRLNFSPAAEGETPILERRKNPKRAIREARAATEARGISTQAQEAVRRQREQGGVRRQVQDRRARQEAAERKYLLRQQKKREKKRGR